MDQLFTVLRKLRHLITLLIILLFVEYTQSQIGAVIWEENFDNLDNWTPAYGNGSWGWGNGELEFYKEDNVAIDEIPGEPGNNALHITAKARIRSGDR